MNKKIILTSLIGTFLLSPTAILADQVHSSAYSSVTITSSKTPSYQEQRQVAHKIANVFKKHHYSHDDQVGMVALALYESNLNPNSVSATGNFGLYNWTPDGHDGKIMLKQNSHPTLNDQLNFLDQHIGNGKHIHETHSSLYGDYTESFVEGMVKDYEHGPSVNHERVKQCIKKAKALLND